MIKIEKFEGLLDFCIDELGGIVNELRDANTQDPFYVPIPITGGELDGFKGYIGHNPEKDVSWTLVPFGGYFKLEVIPQSFESWVVLKYTP